MMKSAAGFIFVLFVGLTVFASVGFGQEWVTREQWLARIDGVQLRLDDKPYRSTEHIDDKVSDRSFTYIFERVSSDRWRLSTVETREDDDPSERTIIRVGKWEYTKSSGDDEWEKSDAVVEDDAPRKFDPKGNYQYSIESVAVDGQSLTLFESLEILNKDNRLWFREHKIWATGDGLPYKIEETRGYLSNREETYKSVKTYEYNPKDLKIEAPMK